MPKLKTVLIIDDSTLSRSIIRSMTLASYPGCIIIEAGSGEEALTKLDSEVPDLITIDYNMPGMSFFDLAPALKLKSPSSKLALITANIQQPVRRRIQSLGILFLAIVEKPITKENMQHIFDTFV